ncbi:MAG: tRNA(fMet)-specific endonuclease VapC [Turneriella sp.]|nr:tRNA(fMet)-specific endonuclease VapC [Turneriella sp.]
MVFIDTSVWIDFFRPKPHACKNEVIRLLDDDNVALAYPVFAELLIGANKTDAARLVPLLQALPQHYPSQKSCEMITEMIHIARQKGYTFAFADLLIAALAREAKATIWSFDSDFQFMEKLNLVRLYKWQYK